MKEEESRLHSGYSVRVCRRLSTRLSAGDMMSTLWPKEMPRHTDSEAEKKMYGALKTGLPKGWQAWHSLRLRSRKTGQPDETDFIIAHWRSPHRPRHEPRGRGKHHLRYISSIQGPRTTCGNRHGPSSGIESIRKADAYCRIPGAEPA